MQGYDIADMLNFQQNLYKVDRPTSAKYPSMNKPVLFKQNDLSQIDLRKTDKNNISIIKTFNSISKRSHHNISRNIKRSP